MSEDRKRGEGESGERFSKDSDGLFRSSVRLDPDTNRLDDLGAAARKIHCLGGFP